MKFGLPELAGCINTAMIAMKHSKTQRCKGYTPGGFSFMFIFHY